MNLQAFSTDQITLHTVWSGTVFTAFGTNMMAERFKLSRRSKPNSFEQLDSAMNDYYISVGNHNYYSDNAKTGKLSKYCKFNGIDIDDIADELKYDPLDCLLVDFDVKFPFHPSHSIQTKNEQTLIKYNIIKYCYENGKAPLFTQNENKNENENEISSSPPNPLQHKVCIHKIPPF